MGYEREAGVVEHHGFPSLSYNIGDGNIEISWVSEHYNGANRS